MNSDGLKPAGSRKKWAQQYKSAANPTIKRTSLQTGPNPVGGKSPRGTSSPPKASRVPNTQAFTDRYPITLLLARYAQVGAAQVESGFNLQAFVYTPSTRLRCRINVFFEADADLGADPTFITQPVWSITSMARNAISGRQSALQSLYPSVTPGQYQFAGGSVGASGVADLPDEFTLDNAGELVRVNIRLDNNQFNEAYAPDDDEHDVNCMLGVTWEPNTMIGAAELNSFYRDCKVSYGAAPIIQKVVIP